MNHRIYLTAALTSAAITLQAQSLHKEIEVEREIVPVERQATRINMLPSIELPQLTPVKLSLSDRIVTTSVAPTFSPLDPVSPASGLLTADHRGYLRAGIFPIFNASLQAGYRIVQTDHTRLAAWLDYDGDLYRRGLPDADLDSKYWRDHSVKVGAQLSQKIGDKSALDAGIVYGYARHNLWTPNEEDQVSTFNQWHNRLNLNAMFRSSVEGLKYHAGVRFERFSYGLKDVNPARQHVYGLDLDGMIEVGQDSRFGLGLNADLLHNSLLDESDNTGLISLNPRYEYTPEGSFSARVGALVDISINDGKAFHIAPDVMAAWRPSSCFGVELQATGGVKLNTLSSLYDVTPYIYSMWSYGRSFVPVDARARVLIGPFSGAYLRIEGGYAKANDWLMPMRNFTLPGEGAFFSAVDLSAWHAEVEAGWKSSAVEISAAYATAPSSLTKGYYLWRDRARHVLSARLAVKPVDKLTVEVGFQLRACRAIYEANYVSSPLDGVEMLVAERADLGNATDLSLRADYRLTDTFTVFAQGENLLNRNYLYLGDRPAQGATGLVGIILKF
ncbi:MAG: hypothetical protein NC098_04995 [Lachnoclostridium sp.]|nr:hypothetical protein [Lachnoclostridium sp.]